MKLTATCPTCGAELELEDLAPGTAVECHAGDAALRAAAAALPDVRGEYAAPQHEKASPANVAGLERMTDAELRALARAVRELLRARGG